MSVLVAKLPSRQVAQLTQRLFIVIVIVVVAAIVFVVVVAPIVIALIAAHCSIRAMSLFRRMARQMGNNFGPISN